MCRVLKGCSHVVDLFGGKFGFTSVTENWEVIDSLAVTKLNS